MNILIITEKPSVASDVAGALCGDAKRRGSFYFGKVGNDNIVVGYAFGHLIKQNFPPDTKKAYDIDDLPILTPLVLEANDEEAEKHVRELADKAAKADCVINACDAGREGELIYRWVAEFGGFANAKAYRLWLQSMTPDAIRNAFRDRVPLSEKDSLFHAARCRAESDFFYGVNGSRALSKLHEYVTGERTIRSIGRVQTPTLAFVVVREWQINKFLPNNFWQFKGNFLIDGQAYSGLLVNPDIKEPTSFRFFDRPRLNHLEQHFKTSVIDRVADEVTDKKENAPKLFDLTTLQRVANQKFGYSAADTLKIAQALYEKHKLLTYPRTDSNHLPNDYVDTIINDVLPQAVGDYASFAQEILKNQWVKPDKRIFNNEKISDHFAIIPTAKKTDLSTLADEERQVFDLVMRRFLAVFYPACEFSTTQRTTCVIESAEPAGDHMEYVFISRGKIIKKQGWRLIYDNDDDEEAGEDTLPAITEQSVTGIASYEIITDKTKPPARFTDASLLAAMESAGRHVSEDFSDVMKDKGLGTPATRAGIIEGLLSEKKQYLARQGKSLVPTPKGIDLIGFLRSCDLSPLLKAELTGEWENKLLLVEQGKLDPQKYMDAMKNFVSYVLDTLKEHVPEKRLSASEKSISAKCPKCSQPMVEKRALCGCTSCDYVIWKTFCGRAFSGEEMNALLAGEKLENLSGFHSKPKEGAAESPKDFSASVVLNEEHRINFCDSFLKSPCPVCSGQMMVKSKTFSCTACDYVLWRSLSGREFSILEAETLLTTGKLKSVTGFYSQKSDKKFGAGVKLDAAGKPEFVFTASKKKKR